MPIMKKQVQPIGLPPNRNGTQQQLAPMENKMLMAPPSLKAPESSWNKFKSWLKDTKIISSSLGHLSRLELLNQYKDFLTGASVAAGTIGYGKKKKGKMIKNHDKLIKHIEMRGGSWSSFTDWIKGAANTVGNAVKDTANNVGNSFKNAGETVFNKVLKPTALYIKKKPLSSAGYLAKGLSWIPSPLSPLLNTASTALGVAGTLTGNGIVSQSGGSRYNAYQKTIMQF